MIDPTLLAEVRLIVATTLRVDPSDVDPAAKLAEIVHVDSLTLVELASALDDRFGTHIPSKALDRVVTVRDLTEILQEAREDPRSR